MKFHFDPKLVKTEIYAENKEQAIPLIADMLIQAGYVASNYPELVLQREQAYPTGLVTKGAVIAIPHSFSEDIKGNHVAIGILRHPVMFQNMEDMEETISVKIIFMLAINSAHEQLEMLQILMQMFKEENLLKTISSMDSSNEICEALNAYIKGL